ncbi:MAG: hypothetical protein HOP29_03010 [Phycisphaerales bacterium]|nr:hypothetical protein [Phycisphaerales bacterium]
MTIRSRYNTARGAAAVLLTTVVSSAVSPFVQASDCNGISVGRVPINDLATGLYLGQYQGGWYPGGSNDVPPAHAAEGLSRAISIQALDINGNPDPDGKYVLLSIGMSNTTQEFCSQSSDPPCDSWTFMGQAAVHPDVNQTGLAIVNGARGGQTSAAWDQPTDANYDRIRDTRLIPLGLSEAQVQIAWVKVANAGPTVSLPNPTADANIMLAQMGNIARTLKTRYPNLKQAFFSSRIYAGYASTTLNPEPYAYEGGFAVKWLIEAQINEMTGGGTHPLAGNLNYDTVAPWIAWGPYLWGDGLNPRSDGLIWACADMQSDGTHPAASGEGKVGAMLLQFMLDSRFTSPWFRIAPPPTSVPSHSLFAAIATACIIGSLACLAIRRTSSVRHSTIGGSP